MAAGGLKPWVVALLAVLMALSAFVFMPPSSASAETTDDGQEVTDFYLAGVVFAVSSLPILLLQLWRNLRPAATA